MAKYVEKFVLPSEEIEEKLIDARMEYNGRDFGYIDNIYPCRLFTAKQLTELDFEVITILYGGNGSGKSTLLNLIANKLRLKRIADFNNSELYNEFLDYCKIRMAEDEEGYIFQQVPHKSRIITSDDIFEYMATARENNREIANNTEDMRIEYKKLKYGENIRLEGLSNYEEFSKQVDARKKSLSKRKFLYII